MINTFNLILRIVKKILLSFCLIYGFDIGAANLNILIPINIITITIVTLLGVPGMLSLIAIYFFL